jgi:hypothetical protein
MAAMTPLRASFMGLLESKTAVFLICLNLFRDEGRRAYRSNRV